jgi:hypothetical protein
MRVLALSPGRSVPEHAPAIPDRLDERTIGPRTEDPDRRISRPDRSEKGKGDQKQREPDVGPGVERPLPRPLDGQTLRERSKVRERPEIVSATPARAYDVAKEVKVHGKNADGEHAEAIGGEERQHQRNGNRRKDTVENSVVILAVVPRAGSPQKTISPIEQDTKAVGVRKNTAPGYQCPVASLEAKCVGQRPRSQKVGDWAHRFPRDLTFKLTGPHKQATPRLRGSGGMNR